MLKYLQKIAASVLGIPKIRVLLEKLAVALGAAGIVEAISRALDPGTARITDGLKSVQQAVETGLETLRTTLVSAMELVTGDPAAREKIGELNRLGKLEDPRAEDLQDQKANRAGIELEQEIGSTSFDQNGRPFLNDQQMAALDQEAVGVEERVAQLEKRLDEIQARRLKFLNTELTQTETEIGADAGTETVANPATPAAMMEGADQAFGELEATLDRADESMARVFANMTEGGAGAADELSRIFADMDNNLLGSMGKLGSIISHFFGSGPITTLGSILGFAGGGTVQPGMPVLVGERGPEIFLPGGPGQVMNAHNSARVMGNAGQKPPVLNQNVYFTTDVRNSVRAEVLNALPLATNAAVLKVSDMLLGIRR